MSTSQNYIDYVKAHFERFDPKEFYKEFQFSDETTGTTALVATIDAIAQWNSNSPLHLWATRHRRNKCQEFETLSVEQHWTKVEEIKVGLKRQRAFASLTKDVYDDMRNEAGGSSSHRRKSQRITTSKKKDNVSAQKKQGDRKKPLDDKIVLDVIKGLSTVSELDRLKLLYSTFGDGTGTMNLEMDKFPERYRSNISTALKFLKFDYAVTHEEAAVLARVAHCSNETELKKLKSDLFAMKEEDVMPGVEYIRGAIYNMLRLWASKKLLHNNGEDWWRIHVYGQLFDMAFLSLDGFDVKRSEVNASAVKEYNMINRDTTPMAHHKLDFKLVDLNGGNTDVLVGEDKPGSCPPKAIRDTEEKNRNIRALNINTIARKLCHPSLVQHFEALTALWQGNELVIAGTRKCDNIVYHYEACRCSFSLTPGGYLDLAKLLLTILSLKERVLLTPKKIETLNSEIFQLAIMDGSRSPLALGGRDDSGEIDEETIRYLASKLPITKYLADLGKAVDDVSYGPDVISSQRLTAIFKTQTDAPISRNEELPEHQGHMHRLPIDIRTTSTQIKIIADMPGISKDDIDIEVSTSSIIISAHRHDADGGHEVVQQERLMGEYNRSIELPHLVNTDPVDATYECGILTIILNKTQKAIPRKISL